MRLLSILIGTPTVYGIPGSDDPMDRVFTSAIGKTPVGGRVWAAQLGLSGDAVADRKHHGGADQALRPTRRSTMHAGGRNGCGKTSGPAPLAKT